MPIYRCMEMSKVTQHIKAETHTQAAEMFVEREYWPDGWLDAEITVERRRQRWKLLIKIPDRG